MNSSVIFVLALVLILVIVELVCRWVFPKPLLWPKPQIREKLDKRFGYLMAPNQKGYSMDGQVTINRYGFRGSGEMSLEDRKADVRILALGNSLTFGAGVDDDETYPHQLEQLLRSQYPEQSVEVINAGIVGFTLQQYAPFLQHKLPEIKPDLVILGTAWLDFFHFRKFGGGVDPEAWEAVKKKFENKIAWKAAPKSRAKRIRDALRHLRSVYAAGHYFNEARQSLARTNYRRFRGALLGGNLWEKAEQTQGEEKEAYEEIASRVERAKANLVDVFEVCNDAGCGLLVAIFPDHEQIMASYPKSLWPSIFVALCQERGVPHVDLLPALSDAYARYGKKRLCTPYDVTHYTAEGNKAIAEAVFRRLQEVGLAVPPEIGKTVSLH